jgi:NADPH:quinone reductase-like Zn-dependent oxidoreductase
MRYVFEHDCRISFHNSQSKTVHDIAAARVRDARYRPVKDVLISLEDLQKRHLLEARNASLFNPLPTRHPQLQTPANSFQTTTLSTMTASFPSTFRAYQYDRYGKLDQELKFRDSVQHKPLGAKEVRVKVHAASINPIDYFLIEVGAVFIGPSPAPSPSTPFGFGFDLSGTVVEVGADAKRLKVGDDVFAMTKWNGLGAVADYVAIDEEDVALKPKRATFEQAAAVPLAGLTSYQALFQHAKLQPGETVLILGGSSSTGSFAIQFAKSAGAKVIVTASAANIERVKAAGADQVIDYKTEKWADVLDAHSIDVLYDCGMEVDAWNTGAQKVLKANTGRFLTLLPLPDHVREAEHGATNLGNILVQPSSEQLGKIASLIQGGKVVPPVDSVFQIDELPAAITRVQSRRAPGKVVIHIQ